MDRPGHLAGSPGLHLCRRPAAAGRRQIARAAHRAEAFARQPIAQDSTPSRLVRRRLCSITLSATAPVRRLPGLTPKQATIRLLRGPPNGIPDLAVAPSRRWLIDEDRCAASFVLYRDPQAASRRARQRQSRASPRRQSSAWPAAARRALGHGRHRRRGPRRSRAEGRSWGRRSRLELYPDSPSAPARRRRTGCRRRAGGGPAATGNSRTPCRSDA